MFCMSAIARVCMVIVMQLRYSFRIEPTPGQRIALARAFGCARVVFNDALRARRAAREEGRPFPKVGDLSKQVITEAKRTPERAWLGEVSAVVLQQSLRDLDTAYSNFFASMKGDPQGGEDRRAPVQVEEGQPAGRQVHRQCALVAHTGREVESAEDRPGAGPLVP